jgi:transposase-like protein
MTKQTRDPEVSAKPTRRAFTAADKRRILAAADTLKAAGESLGPMLRREGLYRSQLSDWRRALAAHGDDGLVPSKRGPRGKASTESRLELRQRDRRIAALERKLEHAAIIIELQKKVLELAATSASLNDEASS